MCANLFDLSVKSSEYFSQPFTLYIFKIVYNNSPPVVMIAFEDAATIRLYYNEILLCSRGVWGEETR